MARLIPIFWLAANVRVSTLALSAEMHVCRKLAEETGGVIGVSLDKAHFRDWLLGQCVPPPTHGASNAPQTSKFACDMVQMGFPTRISSGKFLISQNFFFFMSFLVTKIIVFSFLLPFFFKDVPTLVHASQDTTLLARTAYTCPQCQAKLSELPVDCAVCGLKLVLSPHLARSFHHLFPVSPFVEVSLQESESLESAQKLDTVQADKSVSTSSSTLLRQHQQQPIQLDSSLLISSSDSGICCYACLRAFNPGDSVTKSSFGTSAGGKEGEETLRFQCPECKNFFCVDCDAFMHESLHNCPGCLCK